MQAMCPQQAWCPDRLQGVVVALRSLGWAWRRRCWSAQTMCIVSLWFLHTGRCLLPSFNSNGVSIMQDLDPEFYRSLALPSAQSKHRRIYQTCLPAVRPLCGCLQRRFDSDRCDLYIKTRKASVIWLIYCTQGGTKWHSSKPLFKSWGTSECILHKQSTCSHKHVIFSCLVI